MTFDNEQLVKELTAKDESKACAAAQSIVNNANTKQLTKKILGIFLHF